VNLPCTSVGQTGIDGAAVSMKQTIRDILEYFREEAENNRDLGDKFERLIAAYLTKDRYFANLYSDVSI
jgi:predicted helicase